MDENLIYELEQNDQNSEELRKNSLSLIESIKNKDELLNYETNQLQIYSEFLTNVVIREQIIHQMKFEWIRLPPFNDNFSFMLENPSCIYAFEHVIGSWRKSLIKAFENRNYSHYSIVVFTAENHDDFLEKYIDAYKNMFLFKKLSVGFFINFLDKKKIYQDYLPKKTNTLFVNSQEAKATIQSLVKTLN